MSKYLNTLTTQFAHKWFFTRVNPSMLFHIPFLWKSFAAVIAGMWFVSGMNPQVSIQVGTLSKSKDGNNEIINQKFSWLANWFVLQECLHKDSAYLFPHSSQQWVYLTSSSSWTRKWAFNSGAVVKVFPQSPHGLSLRSAWASICRLIKYEAVYSFPQSLQL